MEEINIPGLKTKSFKVLFENDRYLVLKQPDWKATFVCPACGSLINVGTDKHVRCNCPLCQSKFKVTRFQKYMRVYPRDDSRLRFILHKDGRLLDPLTGKLIMTYDEYAKIPPGVLRKFIEIYKGE